jgi:P27 family predicted phage terminase small subunit
LLPEAADLWRSLGPELLKLRLLTVLDHTSFAVLCQAYARWQAAERAIGDVLITKNSHGAWSRNPLLKAAGDAANLFMKIGSEFGLTPCARSRLKACEETGSGKFDGLLG